MCKLT